jgi:hypothetical protein
LTVKLAVDMSAAPEIARLAEALLLAPAQPATTKTTTGTGARTGGEDLPQPEVPGTPAPQLTLGTLARRLRMIAAAPERWWGLVRFDPGRSVKITIEAQPAYDAWLMVLPPGDTGRSCDCDVVTMIAGEATEGAAASASLRPGPTRVHGGRHWLRGHGASYSVSLHARAHRPDRGKPTARSLT